MDYPEGFNNTNATEAASATAAIKARQSLNAAAEPSPVVTPFVSQVAHGVDGREVNYPPYAIDHVQHGHDLAVHAVSPNATHSDGSLEYDMHSLWGGLIFRQCRSGAFADSFIGHLESKATYESLLKVFPGKRPFIISRSTAPGTGAWAGHWGKALPA